MQDNFEVSEINEKNLDEVYLEINLLYRKLDTIQVSSTSTEFQSIINRGITLGRFLWDNVENLSLYSSNENIDDITTESLKFMTIPAIIGYFYYNMISDTRLKTLRDVKRYYNVFLELMTDYKFKGVLEDFGLHTESRDEKIQRFKDEKIDKERFLTLEKYINQDSVDDEIKREYYISFIKQWISRIKNDIKMLNDEIYMLENEDSIKKEIPKNEAPKTVLKPFVITSDMVKNSVFGMGYKSLPTYSLEEYYVKQVERGHLPDPNVDKIPVGDGSNVRRIIPDVRSEEEKVNERNDYLEDSHDIESRLKKMGMDNYKDDNRRGCGSTMNRG